MSKINLADSMNDLWTRDAVLGALIARMEIVHVEGNENTNTIATNGKQLFINDAWASKLTRNQMTIVLAHEALHPARGHTLRRLTNDQEIHNKAADAAINHELRGWPAYDWVEKTSCIASKLGMDEGQAYEVYVKALEQKDEPDAGKENSDDETDENKSGKSQEDGQDDGQDEAGKTQETDSGDTDGLDEDGNPTMGGDVLDDPEPDKAKAEQEQEQQMMEAISIAEEAGDLPGWAQELKAKLTAKPTLNWKTLLRQWLLQRAKIRRSFERPSRRQAVLGGDLIRPGRGGRKVGKVAFLADVSGSMWAYQEKLDQAIGEIIGLAKAMPDTEIRVIQWDAAVIKITDIKGDAEKKTMDWNWQGGGGTIIEPALKAAKEWRAEVQVVWTDGEFSMPEKMLTPTLWCVVSGQEISKKLGSTIQI
jgi:predicted metal-dependent peptidase